MGITPWYDVWCDAEDCIDWTNGGATRSDAAKAAHAVGWKKEHNGWKCPQHQKGAKRRDDHGEG